MRRHRHTGCLQGEIHGMDQRHDGGGQGVKFKLFVGQWRVTISANTKKNTAENGKLSCAKVFPKREFLLRLLCDSHSFA